MTMFGSFEMWVGSRYVRSRSSNQFVSLISAISMGGIAVAVAVLSPGDDVASYDGTDTIDIGNGNEVTNAQADVAASSVYAMLVTVTVQ